jgi:hypothetical protein
MIATWTDAPSSLQRTLFGAIPRSGLGALESMGSLMSVDLARQEPLNEGDHAREMGVAYLGANGG